MKKVIGIYTYYHGMNEPYWDENSDNMGGSETWTIRIAEEFQKKGFHVIVFGNPQVWHFSAGGVEYVPKQLFGLRCQYQHFDYFISSRTAIISALILGSKFPVGSSQRSILGLFTIALAIATLCCSPPDNWSG